MVNKQPDSFQIYDSQSIIQKTLLEKAPNWIKIQTDIPQALTLGQNIHVEEICLGSCGCFTQKVQVFIYIIAAQVNAN